MMICPLDGVSSPRMIHCHGLTEHGDLSAWMTFPYALSLSDSNIDFRKGSIDICPGSLCRHRTIPMGSDVQRVLLRHLRSPERASRPKVNLIAR